MSDRAFAIVICASASLGPALHKEVSDLGYSAWFAATAARCEEILEQQEQTLLLCAADRKPLSYIRSGRVLVVPVGKPTPNALTEAFAGGAADWLALPLRRSDLQRCIALQQTLAAQRHQTEALDPMTVAGRVMHEVNNPLTALMAYTDELRGALDRQRMGQVRDSLTHIESTLEHLRAVARSGRTLLRKDDGPGNAMVAIQAAVVMAGRRRKPKVTTHIDVNIPPVTMPTYRLAQVVLNLVINAGKAGSRTVVISALSMRDRVLLDVIDDGVGMNAETLGKALGHGYTTRKTGLGIGLGLVQDLVKQSGGQVELASQQGAGTQVRLSLPVASRGD